MRKKKKLYRTLVEKEGQSVSKVEGTSGCDRLRYEEKVIRPLLFTFSHCRVKRSSPTTTVWNVNPGGGIATRRNVGHKAFIGHNLPDRHRSQLHSSLAATLIAR